jgi:hypothetical protein
MGRLFDCEDNEVRILFAGDCEGQILELIPANVIRV